MMRSSRSKWISGIGAVVLSGGLLVAGYGTGVPPAEATGTLVNPFPIIIDKLNQILAKLSTSGGGAGNHTLRWDTVQPGTTRFVTLTDFASAAVLDNETGLVWEKAPSQTAVTFWGEARNTCANKAVGGRKGWRLPSVVELSSLVDPSVSLGPTLPAGHPFTGIQSLDYWSATSLAEDTTQAWDVFFDANGVVYSYFKPGSNRYAWCVRGPMQESVY